MLATNEELTEALRIYDEIERVGMENEVERNARERSRVEVRGNAQVRFVVDVFPVWDFVGLNGVLHCVK